MKWTRIPLALAAPLLVTACLLTPGKFTSTLDIKRDRSFAFTYVGEAILLDPQEKMTKSSTPDADSDENADEAKPTPPPAPDEPAVETQEQIVKRRAIADALSKEAGYRSVEYLGKGVYRVDYLMTGKLDRAYIFPFNMDAQAVFPWVAIEARKDGTVRVKAPGFGKSDTGGGMPGNPLDEASGKREGTFTLTSDVTVVMQNNEDGLAAGPGTKIVWTVTPTSATVPTAVLRFTN